MKRLLVAIALGLTAFTFACKYVVPKFDARATDGTTYKTGGLVGKPTIFVFISGKNEEAIAGLNKLAANYKGHVQVLGVVQAKVSQAKRFAKANRIMFPLLADADGEIAKGFEAKSNLDMTIVASKSGEPRFPKIWKGYSKANLDELLKMIEHHGFALPRVK